MNKARRKRIEEANAKITEAINILQEVHDEEAEAYDNLPESLKLSDLGDKLYDGSCVLDNAINVLDEVVCELESCFW